MKYHIRPSSLMGHIHIPTSKSHTLRAILFGLMGRGTTAIHHALASPDAASMIESCRLFGAKIQVSGDTLEIQGVGDALSSLQSQDVIHAGNSGQVLRFLGAIAGLSSGYTVITGDASIRHQRPVKPLLEALEQLGAWTASLRGDGQAPILIRGPIKAGSVVMEGADSQPVSGMLIAASFLPGTTHIQVKNAGEKPWIALTLDWLKRLGVHCTHRDYEEFWVEGRKEPYEGFHYTVPGDFSSAAYPIAAALITQSEITVHNIDMEDVQGDKKIIHLLEQMGAQFEMDPIQRRLKVKKGAALCGQRLDLNDTIDAITLFAVLGCFAEGKTEIVNAKIARYKECDRIASIARELKKMGARIEEKEDGLVVYPSSLHGSHLESEHDHRMSMALTVAALGAKGDSCIQGTECVVKSFPSFDTSMKKLGACIEVEV